MRLGKNITLIITLIVIITPIVKNYNSYFNAYYYSSSSSLSLSIFEKDHALTTEVLMMGNNNNNNNNNSTSNREEYAPTATNNTNANSTTSTLVVDDGAAAATTSTSTNSTVQKLLDDNVREQQQGIRIQQPEVGDDENSNILPIVVVGMEHSGTTVLSELIMSVPGLGGAFETGFLLSPKGLPANFIHVKPFYAWMMSGQATMLQLSHEQVDVLVSETTTIMDMYKYVLQNSPVLQRTNTTLYVDKTPKYYYFLPRIMKHIPVTTKIVVSQKTYEQQYHSWVTKLNISADSFNKQWQKGERSLQQAMNKYGRHRFYVQNYYDLFSKSNHNETTSSSRNNQTTNATTTKHHAAAEKLFKWLNITFDPLYYTGQPLKNKGAQCTKLCGSKY